MPGMLRIAELMVDPRACTGTSGEYLEIENPSLTVTIELAGRSAGVLSEFGDGAGRMVDWVYKKGEDYLPSDEEVAKLRPASN